jgi:peptide/nickel transport system permease protein
MWRLTWHRLRRDRAAMIALAVLLAVAAAALLAPVLEPFDPIRQLDTLLLRAQAPSATHWFGTDGFSRDVLSRVLAGARVSLAVATCSVLIATTLGTAWGALAGVAGPALDAVLMRIVDGGLAIPRILLMIAVLAILDHVRTDLLVVLLGVTGWFGVARIVRGEVRAIAARDYVRSAEALGASRMRLLWRHVLPNVAATVLVAATLAVGNVIVLEAGLSYLGIGVQPPDPSWGNIIYDGADQIGSMWWVSVFPGLAIIATVVAINVLGDGLRDALDPRQLPRR